MYIDRNKLELALAQKSMSRRELSRRSGVSMSTLWRIVNGDNAHTSTVGVICHTLGISPADITIPKT